MDEQIYRLARLTAYCKHNETVKSNLLHRHLLEKIVSQAQMIGIESPFLHFMEVDLVGEDERNNGDADIVFVDGKKRLFLVEGKIVYSPRSMPNISGINYQLHKYYSFFQNMFGLSPHLFGAYKRIESKKIRCYALEPPTCNDDTAGA